VLQSSPGRAAPSPVSFEKPDLFTPKSHARLKWRELLF
jgi:hypothetical protein